jgi:predicted ABC-type ATPase
MRAAPATARNSYSKRWLADKLRESSDERPVKGDEKHRAMTTTGGHPTVYVIAGPNGAGKTTFATEFLPDFVKCREFLNADLIAAGLSPFAPETQNMRAGRLLLERIGELSRARRDFGFETTLSGRTHAKLLTDLKRSGYRIDLFFLWLPSPDVAVLRVGSRVLKGGHAVPVEVVRRRYFSGLRNFFRLYRSRVDRLWFYDSSLFPPRLIALEEQGVLAANDAELFLEIERRTED